MRSVRLHSLSDHSPSRGKKVYLRVPWIILAGMLLLVLFVALNELLIFPRDAALLQQNLETSEAGKTLAIQESIDENVRAQDWKTVQLEFRRLAGVLKNNHLTLVNASGLVLADSRSDMSGQVIDIGQISITNPEKQIIVWRSQHKLLWIITPFVDQRGRVIAILINETDNAAQFATLFQNRTSQTTFFLLFLFLVTGVFMIIAWLLFISPLNRIYHLSRAIAQGSQQERAPDSVVIELQQINTAFNEMVDHLANQSASLEELNRGLENTVAERTRALEDSNAAIRERADQLEAINSLIASNAAALDTQTLAYTALEQAMQIVHVDQGVIRINEYSTSMGMPNEAGSVIIQAMPAGRLMQKNQHLAVDDWTALPPHHPLMPIVESILQHNIRASITLSISTSSKTVGTLLLASAQPHAWSAEEIAMLEIITHQLGITAERTQYVEEIRWHNNSMRDLIQQSERLNRTVSLSEVISTIGEGSLELSKADRLAIFQLNAEQKLVYAWSNEIDPTFLEVLKQNIEQLCAPEVPLNLTPTLVNDASALEEGSAARQVASVGEFSAFGAWPLIFENKASAYVYCFYRDPLEWKQNDLEVLEAFFRQAAASLENARLYEAERAQRNLAEALHDIAATLNSTLDLNEVLEAILNSLGQIVPHDSADIILIEGDMLRPVRWQGIPESAAESFKHWHYPVKSLQNRQRMVNTVQVVVIPDTTQDTGWVWTSGLEWVRSYAGAPICQHGEVTGFIDVMSSVPGFYNLGIAQILQAFANQAAIALENAQLYHNTQQRMAETSALFRAVQPLLTPVEDLLDLSLKITEAVTQEFDSAHCSILLLSENRERLVMIAQSGYLKLRVPDLPIHGPGLTTQAVRTGQVVYCPDVSNEANYVPGADISRSELAIPLYARGQIIGVLNLESPIVDAFDQRGQRLLSSFAERAALGLENARLFETIRQNAEEMTQLSQVAHRRAQEADTLRQATSALSSTLDLQTVFDSILDHLEQVVPHDGACMFLVEDEDFLHVWAVKNISDMANVLHHSFSRHNALFHEIERSMRPLTIPNEKTGEVFGDWVSTEMKRCWMGVPLIVENQFVGVLTLDRREVKLFRAEEMELAQAFANQAAVAVQNARLYEAAQQRARELEALHTATNSLVSTLDLQKLLERILAAATSAIPRAQAAVLHLLDESGQLNLRVHQGMDEDILESAAWNNTGSPWLWVINEHKPLMIYKGSSEGTSVTTMPLLAGWEDRSLMIAPLILESRTLGVITLISSGRTAFTDQELTLLISFANTATAAIHNAQLHSAVQYLAVTDPLTGVYNRRGFFDLAQHLIGQADVFDRPLSAIMIDIDYFKLVNDQYGHDAGDVVLRVLAARCRKVLRESDLICRYGGEEFAILLAESDMLGAKAAANRIFHSITDLPIETAAGPVVVTISVGMACYSADCNTLDKLLKNADRALYLAKARGRSQVCIWEEANPGSETSDTAS